MSRKRIGVVFASIFAAALGLGIDLGARSPEDILSPRPVYAACQAANGTCGIFGNTKTSLMTAQYLESGVGPVVPSASTTWDITANWSQAFPNCGDINETATATVDWNGSNWVLSSTTLTTNIIDIQMCNTAGCGASAASYTLYVKINDPVGSYNLRLVDYASSGGLPDGDLCAGGSRTPVSGSVSATDSVIWGGRCVYNCSYSNGAVIAIYYQ